MKNTKKFRHKSFAPGRHHQGMPGAGGFYWELVVMTGKACEAAWANTAGNAAGQISRPIRLCIGYCNAQGESYLKHRN
jgi:hypothetical protein